MGFIIQHSLKGTESSRTSVNYPLQFLKISRTLVWLRVFFVVSLFFHVLCVKRAASLLPSFWDGACGPVDIPSYATTYSATEINDPKFQPDLMYPTCCIFDLYIQAVEWSPKSHQCVCKLSLGLSMLESSS